MKTVKQNKINKVQYEFKCEICSKRFLEKTLLQQHKKIHNEEKMYGCKLCSYAGNTVKYLGRHMKKVHTEPTIPCEVCGKKFHFQCELKEHMLVHSGAKPHKCKVCGKAFNTTYSLGSHKLIHENRKPFQCPMCDYACRDSSTLRKHKDRHLGKVKIYSCDLCSKVCKSNTYLRMHMNEIHFGVNVYTKPCEICGKMFKTNSTLTIHLKKVHGRQCECKCDICGAISRDKSSLQVHLMSHVDFRPYKCTFDSCGKRFKMLGDLKKHTITHYPELQHSCSTCGRRFARKSRLEVHMKQHETKVKTAQCDLCGVWFYNKKYVALHISKKHGDRRYICDVCGFQTSNKPSIVMHIKSGHHENNRTCKICQKVFKRHIYLKAHYWKSHCIRYKTKPRIKCRQKLIQEIDIKKEIESLPEIDLFEVEKEEIMSFTEERENSLNLDVTTRIDYKIEDARNPEQVLDEQLNLILDEVENEEERIDDAIIDKPKILKVTVEIDAVAKENAERHIRELVDKSKREREMKELEETRRQYNKRIREAIKNKPKKGLTVVKFVNNKDGTDINEKVLSKDNDGSQTKNDIGSVNNIDDKNNDISNDSADKETDNNDNEVGERRNKKLKINTHQCYVCFKLFETKPKLIEHCKEHFDVCCNIMLKKCPLCDYVTDHNLTKHMRLVHKLNIKLPFPGFKDKKHNKDGSRYYYDIEGDIVNKIEIIPSVKNLNKRESVKIDKKRREDKEVAVEKKKLVKKGKEWVIEEERILVKEDYILPKLNVEEVLKIKEEGDDYLGRMKKLSRLAKMKGKKMLFPCDSCQKICQSLCALKLHTRRHNPNAKPFKPKVWKHRINGKQVLKNNQPAITENRNAKPKPIKNKHRCDAELKEFYEKNIKGGDIEFWQFLKIYNRMSRENITDFSDLNKRSDFGIHYDELPKEVEEEKNEEKREVGKKIVKEKKPGFSRVVKMSKKQYLKRMEVKNKLRQKSSVCS